MKRLLLALPLLLGGCAIELSDSIESDYEAGVSHSTIRDPRLFQWLDEQADRASVMGTAGGN